MVYFSFSLDPVHCSTKLSVWAGAAYLRGCIISFQFSVKKRKGTLSITSVHLQHLGHKEGTHHQGHYTPPAHTVHTATIWQTLQECESQNNQTYKQFLSTGHQAAEWLCPMTTSYTQLFSTGNYTCTMLNSVNYICTMYVSSISNVYIQNAYILLSFSAFCCMWTFHTLTCLFFIYSYLIYSSKYILYFCVYIFVWRETCKLRISLLCVYDNKTYWILNLIKLNN